MAVANSFSAIGPEARDPEHLIMYDRWFGFALARQALAQDIFVQGWIMPWYAT